MQPSPTTGNKKEFLKNDRALVCGMFLFYGLCFFGLIGGGFWWIADRTQRFSAQATATAAQVAQVTSTAAARATQHSQYKFIDRFDSANGWMAGPVDDDYFRGDIRVKDGIYVWRVDRVKKTFVQWADFARGAPVKDFDVYLDTKFVASTPGDACGGLVFRKSTKGWDQGSYVFTLCNDSTFRVEYHGQDGWEDISGWKYKDVIKRSDWNRMEINARGNQFVFTINNELVYELTDDRLPEGGLGIIIDMVDNTPAIIWFDNFAYQIP